MTSEDKLKQVAPIIQKMVNAEEVNVSHDTISIGKPFGLEWIGLEIPDGFLPMDDTPEEIAKKIEKDFILNESYWEEQVEQDVCDNGACNLDTLRLWIEDICTLLEYGR